MASYAPTPRTPQATRFSNLKGKPNTPRQTTGLLPRAPTRGVQGAYPPTKLPGYTRQPTLTGTPNLTPDLLRRMAARRLGGA